MAQKPNQAKVERAWRAWLELTRIERSEFFASVREKLAHEHERARRQRGSTLPKDRQVASLRELSIDASELAG
ncbi:hypothetical protein [Bradyrhizobium sp. NBAIM02]|uniref:hypothetical protein n=1 Tax=Bradyrhizobium sp. NBAIM02 TaxID=2793817 RepID=UPI001CD3D955|nr:hypothetical protein [Bradyrhizobium sp. NBAIM02]MCA1503816.1 hypothetical protein [Bradyrhizobium sp. NBAIM02]